MATRRDTWRGSADNLRGSRRSGGASRRVGEEETGGTRTREIRAMTRGEEEEGQVMPEELKEDDLTSDRVSFSSRP